MNTPGAVRSLHDYYNALRNLLLVDDTYSEVKGKCNLLGRLVDAVARVGTDVGVAFAKKATCIV